MKLKFLLLAFVALSMFSCDNKEEQIVNGYANETLDLEYNDVEMTDVAVKHDVTNNTLELVGIVPGEASVVIAGLSTKGAGFKGTNSTTDRTVNVEGSVTGGILDLDVTLTRDNLLVGEWKLLEYKTDDDWYNPTILQSPLSIDVVSERGTVTVGGEEKPVEDFEQGFRGLGQLVPSYLNDIVFGADGFLTAEYRQAANVPFVMAPKGAVSHYVVGETAFILPHLNTVLPAAPAPVSRANDLMGMIEQILAKGIPVGVKQEGEVLTLTIPYELLSVAIPMASELVASLPDDALGDMTPMMKAMLLPQFEGMMSAESYTISIHLTPKVVE